MNSEEEDFDLLKQKHCIFKNVSKIFTSRIERFISF